MFERVPKYGLKLNKSKCLFRAEEIVFLWDKISAQGVQPNQEKIKAIQDMPRSTDKIGVLCIMGKVNSVERIHSELLTKTSCIRELLHKDNNFIWTDKIKSGKGSKRH